MKTFKKILFPIDLSGISQNMVPYVITLAERLNSEIHLLFVVDMFKNISAIDLSNTWIDGGKNEILQDFERKLEDFAKSYFRKNKRYKTKVLVGEIGGEIINYIKSEGIDLIILCTHCRRDMDQCHLWSVAEKVLMMTPVAVLAMDPYKVAAEHYPPPT